MTFASSFGRTFSPTFQPSSQAGGIVGGTVTVGTAADTYIYSTPAYADNNYGAKNVMETYTRNIRKVLMRFNLLSIPASATCTSATLSLTVGGTHYANRTFALFEIASANGNWVEGTANGSAETGSPCWNYKAYDVSTPTSWAGSAGMSTANTDYVDTVLGSIKPTSIQYGGTKLDIPLNASGLAVINSWFGQSTNSGLAGWYTDTASATNWCSKEHTTESYRPTLTVTYE